ncbi:hypothetical protein A2Z33_06035 [Candidatus Gottesmanbacteria bacterium RBG_16_52_11]|uniref:Uncharacterized protein n=1 Tax=Candidatus Gottesmanbacteria bacterium RBG_16_52_11 TaxID=1798374 RepID=A0A1F5YXB5_9BACT|nr:MAG: hypothetical protein A2Z33_06035 [Candidatus Gottesmanbacteria bacterium RBG_16_52_11]
MATSKKSKKVKALHKKLVLSDSFPLVVFLIILLGIVITTFLVMNPKDVGVPEAGVTTPKLYVGLGNNLGEVKRYDMITKKWSSLGQQNHNGINKAVQYGNKLYFGFNDGVIRTYEPGANPAWKGLGDRGEMITSMEVYNGKLYVAHMSAPGTGEKMLESYDGSTWKTLRTDANMKTITVMRAFNGKLFVGYAGSFDHPGQPPYGCYKFYISTNNSWSKEYCPLANGFTAMEVYDGKLWMGDSVLNGNIITTTTGTDVVLINDKPARGVLVFRTYQNRLYTSDMDGVAFVWNNNTAKWNNLGDKGSQVQSMVTGYGDKLFIGDSSGVVTQFDGTDWTVAGDWTGIGNMVIHQP